MNITRKIVLVTCATFAVAALVGTTAPAQAGGFAFEIGGPIQMMDDGNGLPKLPKSHVQFDMTLGDPNEFRDEQPVVQEFSQADYEQAVHECKTKKKLQDLLKLMTANGSDTTIVDGWLDRATRECRKAYL